MNEGGDCTQDAGSGTSLGCFLIAVASSEAVRSRSLHTPPSSSSISTVNTHPSTYDSRRDFKKRERERE